MINTVETSEDFFSVLFLKTIKYRLSGIIWKSQLQYYMYIKKNKILDQHILKSFYNTHLTFISLYIYLFSFFVIDQHAWFDVYQWHRIYDDTSKFIVNSGQFTNCLWIFLKFYIMKSRSTENLEVIHRRNRQKKAAKI